MRTQELKTTILKISGEGQFYGYEMHKQLEQRNIKIGIGRLYSVLAEMKKEGLLKDHWEKSQSGPKRRVYQIARTGRKEREKILLEAIRTVHDFYTEYLIGLPQKYSVFNIMGGILTKGLSKKSSIGYAASRFSEPMRKIIGLLRNMVPKGTLYAIADIANGLDLGIEGVLVVEGTFEDLPMKDDFLDLLVVTGNIKSECLESCLSEWRRVLTNEGRLAIAIPTATISTYEDPLEIGEFIEQREHPRLKSGEALSSKSIQSAMSRFFKKVEEKRVVHISLFMGTGVL